MSNTETHERTALELKIDKYRKLAREAPDHITRRRIQELVAELEQQGRMMDDSRTLSP
jgi:hypothetical protein